MKIWKYKKFAVPAVALVAACALVLSGCGVTSTQMESVAEEVHKKLIGDNTLQVESVSGDKYAYQTLDDTQKLVYDEIVYAIMNREEEIQIATTDIAEMELAYQAVRYDYCEFFWMDQLTYVTYTRGDTVTAIEITPTFTMTESEQEEVQAQIDAEAARMLANAPVDGTDFDKALYVYETLIHEVDYVEDSENNQNIISAFINHATICQGYAYATQYLLQQLGIPCTTVTGDANGESHAWNLVKMDGEYYYIDTTWGNSQYSYRDESAQEDTSAKYMDYDYFGATTQTILTTHTPDTEIALPECTATADNYFIHQGLYVDTWDEAYIGGIIANASASGQNAVQIKFASVELWEQAMQYFVEDGHFFDYCPEAESVRYLEETDTGVMMLMF